MIKPIALRVVSLREVLADHFEYKWKWSFFWRELHIPERENKEASTEIFPNTLQPLAKICAKTIIKITDEKATLGPWWLT